MTVWHDDAVGKVHAQAEKRRQPWPIGRLKQLQRANKEQRDRLRERLLEADELSLSAALEELIEVVPDLVDMALTEAGVDQ